jgi:flagellar basal-body rod protein FlgF
MAQMLLTLSPSHYVRGHAVDQLGLYHAVRGAFVQELRLEVIANNLANTTTAGFKHDRLIFDDVLARRTQTSFRQGVIHPTDNDLDLAINGDGFFKIKTAQGVAYTRAGHFILDRQGQLVTTDGHQVLGDRGPITVTGTQHQIHVDQAGNIYDRGEKVDTIALVDFADKTQLKKMGQTMFTAPAASEKKVPEDKRDVSQGALEMSNLSPVYEMIKMIETHRTFESYTKIIQTMAEMDQKSANQVGRLA